MNKIEELTIVRLLQTYPSSKTEFSKWVKRFIVSQGLYFYFIIVCQHNYFVLCIEKSDVSKAHEKFCLLALEIAEVKWESQLEFKVEVFFWALQLDMNGVSLLVDKLLIFHDQRLVVQALLIIVQKMNPFTGLIKLELDFDLFSSKSTTFFQRKLKPSLSSPQF